MMYALIYTIGLLTHQIHLGPPKKKKLLNVREKQTKQRPKKRGTRKPGGDDISITLIAMAAQVRRACPTHQAAYTKYVQISVYQLKDRKEKEEKKKRRDASAVK